jgi:phage recombination protein Bet
MENQIAKIEFSPDQVKLIKTQIAPNATDNELKLFLYQAQRTGLDPLTRQIYCIHRGGKMTIQTSIDGFRVIAERSGDYGGQDEPIFVEQDVKIICCKVTVYRFRGEQRYPAAVGVAYMSEYNAGGPMWSKMPHTMISKCAEAVALRKAYPQDLSGLYTIDEMDQSNNQEVNVEIERPKANTKTVIESGESDVTNAIIKLDNCFKKEDLAKLKDTLNASVIHSPEFIKAAKKRFQEVTNAN